MAGRGPGQAAGAGLGAGAGHLQHLVEVHPGPAGEGQWGSKTPQSQSMGSVFAKVRTGTVDEATRLAVRQRKQEDCIFGVREVAPSLSVPKKQCFNFVTQLLSLKIKTLEIN